MSRDSFRKIGAILGLVAGMVLMRLAGQGGIVLGAICGAGGAVAGGILGEQLHGALRRGK
jgi:uncharacterized membrane protein YeaQ/YmgE (transglycosylase-associated protein family)